MDALSQVEQATERLTPGGPNLYRELRERLEKLEEAVMPKKNLTPAIVRQWFEGCYVSVSVTTPDGLTRDIQPKEVADYVHALESAAISLALKLAQD